MAGAAPACVPSYTLLVIRCPSCREENPERARFCWSCGTALAEEPAAAGEERKVVSVLFVDLVGFTDRSDQADPEDVRATLRLYHAQLKREIERFGGTVEKFVGDAVMAAFGAPVAHEDDAERAVRAALRILDEVELDVRAAVNTGEAVVTLGARPEEGEGIVAGDVVNTAARLQGVAPVGRVVVSEATYRATRDLFEYEELEPVALKGKAEPVPIWCAKAPRMRFGVDVELRPTTPFVGREDDLVLLRSTYQRTLRESSIQLVTVTGEPGVGKTRLVSEFRTWVDDRPEIVYWRQGRCLPYGEGITYWALGEIVKGHAGILESDGPEDAAAKLGVAVQEAAEDPSDRDWLSNRLVPLVGAGESSSAEREESFAAWRRFLEGVAEQRPLLLVFEDLHWADDALIAFLEHLVDWSTGVPVLVVCTARPELYERHPGWGGGKRNTATIALSPLTSEDTARLLSSLLARAVLPAETQAALLERCGGNPLYAEEFARMLADRQLLGGDGDVPVPETVQALIAARLDTLAPERKALLHDAAVVGKVFWAGAVASMGGADEGAVQEGLHELARKELVRPARTSSVEGEVEYAFWHLLVRDVAYGQIPRATRARKHASAAAWIERMAADRVADHAELLAHHYELALELARAAGESDEAETLVEPARRFLVMAGERAARLDRAAAESLLRRALDLTPPADAGRAPILLRVGETTLLAGRTAEAASIYEQAEGLFHAAGDALGEAEAVLGHGLAVWHQGDRARARPFWDRALELLEPQPLSPVHARVYSRFAAAHMHYERPHECLAWSERALSVAEQVEAEDVGINSRQYRGFARCLLGDLGGLDDLRETLRLGSERGLAATAATSYINLGDIEWWVDGPAAGLERYRAGAEYAESRGLTRIGKWGQAQTLWLLYELGRWDELLRLAGELTSWSRAQGGSPVEGVSLPYAAAVHVRRGETARAAGLVPEFLRRIRITDEPQVRAPGLLNAALVELAAGNASAAVELVRELAEATRDHPVARSLHLASAVRVSVAAGALDLADELPAGAAESLPRSRYGVLAARAVLAEAHGETEHAAGLYDEAATRWAEYGYLLEHAETLLGAGRSLLALGRDGAGRVREAREILESLGAAPLVVEADALLGDRPAKAPAAN